MDGNEVGLLRIGVGLEIGLDVGIGTGGLIGSSVGAGRELVSDSVFSEQGSTSAQHPARPSFSADQHVGSKSIALSEPAIMCSPPSPHPTEVQTGSDSSPHPVPAT